MVGKKIMKRVSDGIDSVSKVPKDLKEKGPLDTVLNVPRRFSANNRKALKAIKTKSK